jgi:hypothetical protein
MVACTPCRVRLRREVALSPEPSDGKWGGACRPFVCLGLLEGDVGSPSDNAPARGSDSGRWRLGILADPVTAWWRNLHPGESRGTSRPEIANHRTVVRGWDGPNRPTPPVGPGAAIGPTPAIMSAMGPIGPPAPAWARKSMAARPGAGFARRPCRPRPGCPQSCSLSIASQAESGAGNREGFRLSSALRERHIPFHLCVAFGSFSQGLRARSRSASAGRGSRRGARRSGAAGGPRARRPVPAWMPCPPMPRISVERS